MRIICGSSYTPYEEFLDEIEEETLSQMEAVIITRSPISEECGGTLAEETLTKIWDTQTGERKNRGTNGQSRKLMWTTPT